MAYTLNIIKEGQTLNSFHVGRKQYATVPVKAGVQFQVLDDHGKLVKAPKVEIKGKDLWVFLEEGARQPDIILQDYTEFGGIKDPAQLQKMNTTFATTTQGGTSAVPASKQVASRKAVLATEVDSATASEQDTSSRPKFARKGINHTEKVSKPSNSDYENDSAEPDNAGEGGWSPYVVLGAVGVAALGAFAIKKLNDDDDDDGKSSKSSEKTINELLKVDDSIDEGYSIAHEDQYQLVSGGSNSADILKANDSNALIKGLLGNDVLTGKEGNDVLVGGEGSDTLTGGSGNDVLIGGKGADILIGGKGSDIFVFDVLDSGNTDIIADFNASEDSIALSTATKAFVALKDHADKIEDYISYEDGDLYYDATGTSGVAGVGFASIGVDDFDVAQNVTLIG